MFVKKENLNYDVVQGLRGGNGKVIKSGLSAEQLPNACTMCSYLTLGQGDEIGRHSHDTNTEIFVMLTGVVEGDDNGTIIVMQPGDMMVTGNGEFHSIINRSAESATMLALIVDAK